MAYSVKKWLLCRWLHRKHRCWPGVEDGNPWHCMKCHPCNEDIDRILALYEAPA